MSEPRTAAATRSTEGMYSSSICPVRIRNVEAGHANDGPAQVEDRLLGEDRRQLGARSPRCAAPPARSTTRPVFGDRREERVLVERVGASARRAPRRRLAFERPRRLAGTRHHRAVCDERDVRALAGDARLAERDEVVALRDLAALGAVDELRLEHDHGIRVADRSGEKPLRVGGRRRDRHLDARRVHVVRLRRVVVQLRRAHAAAVRHADGERELHRAAACASDSGRRA